MTANKKYKITVTAPLFTEAAALAEVAEYLSLPREEERQPDLQYLSAIFVSTGINKNGAVFMGSELLKAQGTIEGKAVDVEHDEQSVIGQITGRVFLNRDRSLVDVETARNTLSVEKQDELEMDVGITAIIHKARFPDLAAEISEGGWMVSMEAYYRDFDIKVGDRIIPREQAEELGFDRLVGSVVQLKDGDTELGFHLVGRVLRDILFAGVGIVKNPANPRSVIMEAAAVNDYVDEEAKKGEIKILNLADIESLEAKQEASSESDLAVVTTPETLKEFICDAVHVAVKAAFNEQKETGAEEGSGGPGTCLHYKRYVYSYPKDDLPDPPTDTSQYPLYNHPGPVGVESPGARVEKEHYCSLFDTECSARPGDATSPECWRNVFARTVKEEITSHEDILRMKRLRMGLVELQRMIDKAKQ